MIIIIKGKSMFYEYFISYKPLLISYKPRFDFLQTPTYFLQTPIYEFIFLYINLLSLNCYYLFTFIIIVFTN